MRAPRQRSDPCIISWPAGTKARGEIRDQYHHAIDLVPTILDILGVESPETIKGHTQSPLDGVSMRESLDDPSVESARKTQFYAMLGSRSIWHARLEGGHHPSVRSPARATSTTTSGELYNTDIDRSELSNLASEQPEKLRELVIIWFAEAGRNGAFPLVDRSPGGSCNTPPTADGRPATRYGTTRTRLRSASGSAREHAEGLVRDRRARRHPGAPEPPRACSSRSGSCFGGACASTSRTTASTT